MISACGGGASPSTTISPTIAAPSSTVTIAADPLAAFEVIEVSLSGEVWDVALADTAELRARGLMGVTGLGGLDGMLFAWDEDVATGFWMKDTVIPLDIAFFTAAGELVDLLRMEPCQSDPCEVYRPAGPYRYAIETGVGRWDAIDRPGLVMPDL